MTTERGPRNAAATFGHRVRTARQFAGVSATDLSLMLGHDRGAVARWERTGELPPDLIVTAVRIAELCAVDHLWLLAGDTRGLVGTTPARRDS